MWHTILGHRQNFVVTFRLDTPNLWNLFELDLDNCQVGWSFPEKSWRRWICGWCGLGSLLFSLVLSDVDHVNLESRNSHRFKMFVLDIGCAHWQLYIYTANRCSSFLTHPPSCFCYKRWQMLSSMGVHSTLHRATFIFTIRIQVCTISGP